MSARINHESQPQVFSPFKAGENLVLHERLSE